MRALSGCILLDVAKATMVLVTMPDDLLEGIDKNLLDAGLGTRPSELAARFANGSGNGEAG